MNLDNSKFLINFLESNINTSFQPFYSRREDRNKFAANVITQLGSKNILNLGGGGERFLEKYLNKNLKVFEVDFQGNNDLNLDLSKLDKLPFKDNQFECVCGFDLLEHLENFHFLTKEMIRITNKDILISLPNSASEIPHIIFGRKPNLKDNTRGVYSKYYGLPIEYQVDRHRWWIYLEDIIRYFKKFSEDYDCEIKFFIQKQSSKKLFLKKIIPKNLYYKFFCDYIWMHLKKNSK